MQNKSLAPFAIYIAIVTFATTVACLAVLGAFSGAESSKNGTVEIFEDGSGVQKVGSKTVHFPENTFFWDCKTMGNKEC